MPVATAVFLLPAAGPSLLGDYLTSVVDGTAVPPDLIAMLVCAEPERDARAEFGAVLPRPLPTSSPALTWPATKSQRWPTDEA